MNADAISEQYAARVAAALATVEQVPPDLRDKQGVTEQWSVKDLLGHCAYWDSVHIAELEAEFSGRSIVEDDREDDVVNAEQFAIRAGWSWDRIMDEVNTICDRLAELLKRPSRTDQSETGAHWVEHHEQIMNWLAQHRDDRSGQVS